MKQIITHKTILIFLIIALLALVFVIVAFISSNKNTGSQIPPSTTPSPTQNTSINTSLINNVSPSQSQLLEPGRVQEFLIFLGKPLYIGNVKITLTGFDYTQADTTPIPVPINATFTSNNIISVKTQGPISAHTTYNLRMITTSDNKTVLNLIYTSKSASAPTPAPTNNLSLASYLPYETNNYKLSYLASQNMYIFNFKYDPNNPATISDQFTQAQQDATKFIESKGIDINSIVIEWRNN